MPSHGSDDDVVDVHARCRDDLRQAVNSRENANIVSLHLDHQIKVARRFVSEAQGMCSDERPHEEINRMLDLAQQAMDR